MIIVGLTGGIASGKSFVVSFLKKLKIPVHESDEVVSKLYRSHNKKFIYFLSNNGFKKSLIDKKINKDLIREEIFSNKQKKINLERYLHKEVRLSRNDFLMKNKKEKIVFLDIPLLFENNLEGVCDVICSTIAPVNLRKKRALQRKGMKENILNQIIKSQTKNAERVKRSNYLINTAQTKTKTCLQVKNIIYDLLKNI